MAGIKVERTPDRLRFARRLRAARVGRPRRAARMRRGMRKVFLTAMLAALGVLFVFPMVLTFANSLMTQHEISVNYAAISAQGTDRTDDPRANGAYVNLKLIPDRATLSQYYAVLIKKPQFLFMFWNSVKLVAPIVCGQIAVASLAGYAFAHLRFRWREPLFFVYIVTMFMPFQVTLVPNFIMADRLGLLNSHWSIIFPGVASAFGVFLLRQYMTYIPYSYIEAARVDGAGHPYIFSRIVLPMCKPGIAALAILVMIDNWNELIDLAFYADKIRSAWQQAAGAAGYAPSPPELLSGRVGWLVNGLFCVGLLLGLPLFYAGVREWAMTGVPEADRIVRFSLCLVAAALLAFAAAWGAGLPYLPQWRDIAALAGLFFGLTLRFSSEQQYFSSEKKC